MNLIKNTNARGNVLDKFNECKEFVNFETDALLVTLAMSYFGIDSTDASPDEVIPPAVMKSKKDEKVEWLYKHVKKIIIQYIVESHSQSISEIHENIAALSKERNPYQCRHPGCSKVYRYDKVRIHHERQSHKLCISDKVAELSKQPSSDDVFNYCTARLNLGLLIRNADDAVREGDGERIVRCWKFFMLYYKAFGHHKYAYASFLLQSKILAILTEAQCEQLVWNRTVNRKGGKGRNISCETYHVTCV